MTARANSAGASADVGMVPGPPPDLGPDPTALPGTIRPVYRDGAASAPEGLAPRPETRHPQNRVAGFRSPPAWSAYAFAPDRVVHQGPITGGIRPDGLPPSQQPERGIPRNHPTPWDAGTYLAGDTDMIRAGQASAIGVPRAWDDE